MCACRSPFTFLPICPPFPRGSPRRVRVEHAPPASRHGRRWRRGEQPRRLGQGRRRRPGRGRRKRGWVQRRRGRRGRRRRRDDGRAARGAAARLRRVALRDVHPLRHPDLHGRVGGGEPRPDPVQPDRARSGPVGGRRGRGPHEVRRPDHSAPRRLRAVGQQRQQLRRRQHPLAWRQGDVVRAYVDAFRANGLAPGLYYSVWDNTKGTASGSAVTPAQIDYVKAQLTELLTNYGPIPMLIFDGWSWKMGHKAVPYQEIRALVKSLQPDCLILDHTHLMSPWDADLAGFEEPQGPCSRPADNTFPAIQDAEDQRQRRQRLVLGAQHRRPDERHAIVDAAPASARAALDELPAQLPAQPRRPARRRRWSRAWREVGAAWSPDPPRPPLPVAGAAESTSLTRRRRDARPAAPPPTRSTAINDWDTLHGVAVVGRAAPVGHRSISVRRGPTSACSITSRATSPNVGPSADGAITSYGDLDQHRRGDVHARDHRRLARRRQDEGGGVRSGGRPLRPPRGPRRQRHQRRRDRDRGRRAALSEAPGDRAPRGTRSLRRL